MATRSQKRRTQIPSSIVSRKRSFRCSTCTVGFSLSACAWGVATVMRLVASLKYSNSSCRSSTSSSKAEATHVQARTLAVASADASDL